MANLAEIDLANQDVFMPNAVQAHFWNDEWGKLLIPSIKEVLDGGTKVIQTIEMGSTPGGAYDPRSDALNHTEAEQFDGFTFYWRTYQYGVVLNGYKQLINGPTGRLLNLWQKKVNNAFMTARRDIWIDMMSANADAGEDPGAGIIGLQTAISSTATTRYGDCLPSAMITPSDVLTPTDAIDSVTTLAAMNYGIIDGLITASTDGEKFPKYVAMSPGQFSKMKSICEGAKVYMGNTNTDLNRWGFTNHFVISNGTTAFIDRNMSNNYSGLMLGVNPSDMVFKLHPERAFTMTTVQASQTNDFIFSDLFVACIFFVADRKHGFFKATVLV